MATPAKSVQFVSVQSVLDFYTDNDIANWAIVQQKQLLCKYEGGDIGEGMSLLTKRIQPLQNSAAIYTLCLYEDEGKINVDTKFDASANFRFLEYGQQPHMNNGSSNNELISELRAMSLVNQKILEKLTEEEEDEPDNTALGMIGEVLKHEAIQPLVPVIVDRLMDFILPAGAAGVPPAAKHLSGIDMNAGIKESLDTLSDHIDVPSLLNQLALLAQRQPAKFNMYAKVLMGMKF